MTKPTPNSTAEKIKKKNVNDTKFKLSYRIPIINVRPYKFIHNNSAVSNRCKDVLVLVIKVLNNMKKRTTNRLTSPKNITNRWG